MLCALCKIREANKKNTHYLTDSIIRTCLNEDGLNIREKGHYFKISNQSLFIDFNFQRGTSQERLLKTLGREATEDEIAKAKDIPFSVDFVFCNKCEDIFTKIETDFTDRYLDSIRNAELAGNENIQIEQFVAAKMFFLLQVWRTAVCDEIYILPNDIMEKLRNLILNHEKVTKEELEEFPLLVTYLETKPTNGGPTSNFVALTDDKNPNLIIMNDFVIQFYADKDNIPFFDFHALNNPEDFNKYLNQVGQAFIIKIIPDADRRRFLNEFITRDDIRSRNESYRESFRQLFYVAFRNMPSEALTEQYMNFLIGSDPENLLKFTKEEVINRTEQFFINYLNN